jgi:DNA replication protein DnaC
MSLEALGARSREEVRRMLAERRAAQQRASERLLGRSGIPARYRDKTFGNYQVTTPQQRRALGVCMAYARLLQEAQQADNLILVGTPGTGKTHLACAIVAEVLGAGRSALFLSMSEALRLMRASFAPDAAYSEPEAIAMLTQVDVLVMDEVGMAIGSEDKRRAMLFDVLDARYSDLRPTVLVSNLSRDELTDYLGERLMDRLCEGGSVLIALAWESYRQRPRSSGSTGLRTV